ncbi:MAG: hypothetical protein HYT79_04660 [Elusimicrobia bacterium]|nr:hypothetical protein [Elusimicrobiota bacterium]
MDEGAYTPNVTKLNASWVSTVDLGSIAEYEYSIGSSSGAVDLKTWTAVATSTFTEVLGLSLQSGNTYYVNVRAKSSWGNISKVGISDGITVDFVKPVFAAPPAAQAEKNDIVISWNKPAIGISGIVRYIVEERRADKPQWKHAVYYTTAGAVSAAGAASVYAVAAANQEPAQYSPQADSVPTITAGQLQIVLTGQPAGTYHYRVKALSGSGVMSDPSQETRVVLGLATKTEVISSVQAYPNPVDIRKLAANIYYDLNQDTDIEIQIYDLFGMPVKTLNFSSGSDGARAGGNTVRWDGSREDGKKVSFGVYLLRVKAKASGTSKVYKLGVVH